MKLKIFWTIAVGIFYLMGLKIYSFFYSPIAGVTTAQSTNDDLPSYAMAKFVRDGGVQSLMFWVALLVIAAIWVLPMVRLSTKSGK